MNTSGITAIKIFFDKVKFRIVLLALKSSKLLISRAVLKISGLEYARPISLREDLSLFRITEVERPSDFKAVAPDFGEHQSNVVLGRYRELNAYKLPAAMANPYSSVYSIRHHLVFSDYLLANIGRVKTDPSCLYHDINYHFRMARPSKHLKQGIHVGGAGAFNWFHFVLECLPKILLANALPEGFRKYPLIAPIECQRIVSFSHAFSLISKGRPACFLKWTELALVDELVVFDEISTAPFNMDQGSWPKLSDYQQHDNIVLKLIAELRAGLNIQQDRQCASNRFFLVRSNERRSYNQEELLEIASSYGFVAVSPELLSLQKQASLFNSASIVIGASGAAWVGMIFAERSITGLSWLPPEYKEFSSYSSLASLLGHRIKFIECMPSRKLISTRDAYSASYSVNPEKFEYSLRNLIAQQ